MSQGISLQNAREQKHVLQKEGKSCLYGMGGKAFHMAHGGKISCSQKDVKHVTRHWFAKQGNACGVRHSSQKGGNAFHSAFLHRTYGEVKHVSQKKLKQVFTKGG